MEQRFTLSGGGTLTVREEGDRLRLTASRAEDRAGLYKVWVSGPEGELLLGTLAPEGGRLGLGRTLSRAALAQAGAFPVTGGRTAMVYPFKADRPRGEAPLWRWEHRPAGRLRDPVLKEAAQAWGPVLIREEEGGFLLAAPLDPERPFPMTPIFCLGRPDRVDGQSHVVFSFDGEGNPRPPHV